jgi:peptidoglycan-associated lipoprotein
MRKILVLATMLFMAFALAGCGKDKTVKPESAAGVEDRGVSVGGVGQEYGPDGQPLGGGAYGGGDLLSERTIYFEFDSANLDEHSRAVVEAHARYLAANSGVKVVLEGHTDERGTREYNLALGERRAKAAEQLMEALGVSNAMITPISYGEEKPVAMGHDESAWRLNRRVEILYGNY